MTAVDYILIAVIRPLDSLRRHTRLPPRIDRIARLAGRSVGRMEVFAVCSSHISAARSPVRRCRSGWHAASCCSRSSSCGWLLAGLLSYLVQRSGLSLGLDRMLGSVFGLVRGAVIVGFAVMLGQAAKLDSEPWWKRSKLMPAGIEMAGILRSYVETGRQMVDDRGRGNLSRTCAASSASSVTARSTSSSTMR